MTARDALAGIIQDHTCRDLPCQIRLPPGAEAYALADRLTAAGYTTTFEGDTNE